MAFVIADRVRETSTTTGTGNFTLAGAVTGYQTFDAVLDTSDTTYYTIADQSGANFEVGIGTFTAPATLARTTILSSSNGGSVVTFGAGTKDVFISLPASKTVQSFSAGSTGLTPSTASFGAVALAGTLVATNGGTGQSSYTIGDLLYASGSTALSKLADIATGNALISGGVATAPSWGKIGLTTHISGTLGVANGGTGTSTAFTAGSVVFAGASGVYSQDNASLFFDDTNNRLGIGTTSPVAKLDIVTGGTGNFPRVRNTTTNSTQKYGGFVGGHYTNTEEDFGFVLGYSDSADNVLSFGGSQGEYNAATILRFYTAANNTTLTGTERLRIDSSGNLLFNSGFGSVATAYGCRAWVNFNGIGTVAIRGSGNVTSITDSGTGLYTVNFTSAMPDVNYSLVITKQNTSVNNDAFVTDDFGSRTTSSCVIYTFENAVQNDTNNCNVAIFR